jgi:hypothetical protein
MAQKLEVELSLIDKISNSVVNINRTMTGFVDNLQKKFDVFTKGFAAIAAVSGVAYGVKRMVDTSNELAQSINKISGQTNLSTKSVQQWDYALRQNESSMESASKSFIEIQKNAYEASNGNKDARSSFEKLKVSVNDSNGNLKTASVLSRDVILALSDMTNEAERTALAKKLLGKSAAELNPLLAQGSEEIKRLIEESEKYGQILDRKTIVAIDRADDTLNAFSRSTTIMGAKIIGMVSGPLEKWASGMLTIIGYVDKLKNKLVGDSQESMLDKFFSDERVEKINSWTGRMFDVGKTSIETSQKIADLTSKIELYESSLKGKTADEFVDGTMKAQVWIDKVKELKRQITELLPSNKSAGGEKRQTSDDINDMLSGLSNRLDTEVNTSIGDLLKSQDELLAGTEQNVDDLNAIFDNLFADIEVGNNQAIKNMFESQDEAIEHIKAKAEELASVYVSLGANMGRAIAEGISEGNLSKALRGMAVEMLDFVENIMLETVAANTLKHIMSAPPGAGWIYGAIRGAAEAVPITAVFETLKAKVSGNMASGGVSSGGVYRVGEHGPEDAYLPMGTRVYNAMNTKNMNTNNTMHATFNIVSGGGRVSERLTAELRRGDADRLITILSDMQAARA